MCRRAEITTASLPERFRSGPAGRDHRCRTSARVFRNRSTGAGEGAVVHIGVGRVAQKTRASAVNNRLLGLGQVTAEPLAASRNMLSFGRWRLSSRASSSHACAILGAERAARRRRGPFCLPAAASGAATRSLLAVPRRRRDRQRGAPVLWRRRRRTRRVEVVSGQIGC